MKEIVIVTQNRRGLIADITNAVGSHGINIEGLNAEEVQDMAVVELTVDKYDEAIECLRDTGFDAIGEEALIVQVPDEPGALARVAKRFKEADIDLRSVRIVRRDSGVAVVAIATERTERARELVKDCLITE